VTFSGDLDQVEADTKTTMWYETGLESGKFTTYFMNGDHIMVNGYESGDITKMDTNGSKINFEIPFDEGKDNGPYYAATAHQVDDTWTLIMMKPLIHIPCLSAALSIIDLLKVILLHHSIQVQIFLRLMVKT
jgi:hypothetical protein